MDKHSFFTTIRDAIHDDSAAQAWSTAKYARNHSVYTMTNPEAPPDPDTVYPVVGIRVSGGTWGHQEGSETISFRIRTALKIESMKTTGKARATEFQGAEYIYDFTRLVGQAFIAALPAGYFTESASEEYSGNDTFPIFECTTNVTAFTYYSQGDAVL